MKIYISLTKNTKKMLKYAILFILGCILVYYANTLDVKAMDTTTSSSLNSYDIVFPTYINWYDNTSGSLSSKSVYNENLPFTNLNDYVYTSRPDSSILSNSGAGGFTLFFTANLSSNKSYMIQLYFLTLNKDLIFNYSYVNSSYRYLQSCTNVGLSSCTSLNYLANGTISSTPFADSSYYLKSTYIRFNTDSITSQQNYLNISVGTSASTTFGLNNYNFFIGYKLIDVTSYSNDTIEGMIQDNQNSLDDLEKDVSVLQQTQETTNDKLDDQIKQEQQQHEETMDTITGTDTSGADNEASGFFNDFESNDFGLSDIITLPLTTIQSITSKSCTPLNLTLPFVNKSFELPCMTTIYSKFEPFYSIYQTITFGVISYWVCVQIYAMVKGFKDPAKDEIEVMDL